MGARVTDQYIRLDQEELELVRQIGTLVLKPLQRNPIARKPL